MKKTTKHNSTTQLRAGLLGLAALLLLALTASTAKATTIFQVNSKTYYGKTYGDWVVAYWQWAMSIPFSINPWANDPTGVNAANGQSGPVWFLGGSLGDSETKNVTIPADKAIFLPVNQWIFGATVGDCAPSNPGVDCNLPTLKKSAAAAAKADSVLEVSIDGLAVSDVKDFRVLSPTAFNVAMPDDNVPEAFGYALPAGTYGPQVADGYYMLLAPLAAGSHTIVVHVISLLGFEYFITYNITSQ
jgi:hypothetical protein